jgi:phosphoribosylformylglycinamidine cyclo-ligase
MAKTYEQAGVSIAAGENLVELIRKDNPLIGGFAGLFPYGPDKFLVACTDGVGTKLELSIAMERYEALGQDLVAMSVNDLLVCGGRPLFFLDYYACGKLDVAVAHRVVRGIQDACKRTGCLLLGGETAEMPGFYDEKKFDLAGFAVGEVERERLVDGKRVAAGDVIVGLPSSGFHANGYSLLRKILRDRNHSLDSPLDGARTVGEVLTEPTRLYVEEVLAVRARADVKAMAHITGGGLTNIARALPEGLTYAVPHERVPTPRYMRTFQEWGGVSDEEAFTVWNMGMGFTLVVPPADVAKVLACVPDAFVAGEIVKA